MEKEQKNLREWEIKYKKLESIYEKDKVKLNEEKAKIKGEMAAFKKRTDEALNELSKLFKINNKFKRLKIKRISISYFFLSIFQL